MPENMLENDSRDGHMMKERFLWLTSAILVMLLAGGYLFWESGDPCHPEEAEATLNKLSSLGVRGVRHPPSLSNLLWIHVGPKWHALSRDEQITIDQTVRCAARTLDAQGQPTWQAAYYDHHTGKLVALTSRRYGFRLQQDDSHFSQDFMESQRKQGATMENHQP